MKIRFAAVITAALALGSVFARADEPFAGKWKLNQANSKFAGVTDSVSAAGQNTYKFTYGTFTWTVKADGTDQPTPFNTTVALTAEGPHKWKLVNKVNGKVTNTEIWTLSADGNSMERASTGTRQNGETYHNTTNVKRIGSGKGFEGKWESSTVNQSSPAEVNIAPAANGALRIAIPSEKIDYTVTFDGKNCPVTGETVPQGVTISGTRPNSRLARVSTKLNGRVLDTEEWKVSDDGKTTTITEHDSGVPTPIIAVYDRI